MKLWNRRPFPRPWVASPTSELQGSLDENNKSTVEDRMMMVIGCDLTFLTESSKGYCALLGYAGNEKLLGSKFGKGERAKHVWTYYVQVV